MEIYFLSSNKYKIKEVSDILEAPNIQVKSFNKKINEIQSDNMIEIVTDKVIKGFKEIGRPVIVEQTGLLIEDFGNLPGGLTQVFWDSLEAEKFSNFFSKGGTALARAKAVIALCDGKKIETFEGEIIGKIVSPPRGKRDFQWDCVFQPDGYEETFAEMGSKKNDISMRKIALNELKFYLEENLHD